MLAMSRIFPAGRAMSPTVNGSVTSTSWDSYAGAFAPPTASSRSRGYLRHRTTLIESAGALVQRMQKALVQMNVQLPLVVSDITGVTGLRILRDIVAGQRDPQHLAQHRDVRCHASEAEIVAALRGNYRPEHVFVLQQNLELFDTYQQQLADV